MGKYTPITVPRSLWVKRFRLWHGLGILGGVEGEGLKLRFIGLMIMGFRVSGLGCSSLELGVTDDRSNGDESYLVVLRQTSTDH